MSRRPTVSEKELAARLAAAEKRDYEALVRRIDKLERIVLQMRPTFFEGIARTKGN